MKRWRIRREVIGGKEWFYPEVRILWWWDDFENGLSGCPIRFETLGEATAWIQQRMRSKAEPISYTYPFD